MNLTLKRTLRSDRFTSGELSIDGIFQCWTMEDKERDLSKGCGNKLKAQTAIPPGKYEMVISFSNRFQKYMPLLLNVPCFDGIRIHSGNTEVDSEGCILVGKERTTGRIMESRKAFAELMAKLSKVEKKEKMFIEII